MVKRLQLSLIALTAALFLISGLNAQTFSGKDFWFGYLSNFDEASTLQVHIASASAATVTVSVPGLAWTQNISVAANTVGTVTIPYATANNSLISDAKTNRGVRVTSNVDVTVYIGNYADFSSDAATAIPTPALGTSYTVIGHGDKSFTNPSSFIVVGTVNNTNVSVKLSQRSKNNAAGSTQNFILNAGEVYVVQSAGTISAGTGGTGWNTDLTGSKVTANKPVAVYGGNICGVVGACSFCDHLFEQVRPTSTWSNTYYLASCDKSSVTADRVKIYFPEDTTTYTVNGLTLVNLTKDTYLEVDLVGGMLISSNKPVNASILLRGSTCSAPPLAIDPLLMDVLPAAQFGAEYIFATSPFARYSVHHATVVVPSAQTATMRRNGVLATPKLPGWIPIAGTTYSYGYFDLTGGTSYKMESTNGTPFGLYVYGYGQEEAYGYTAGGQLKNLCDLTTSNKTACEGDMVKLGAASPYPNINYGYRWYTSQFGGSPIFTGDSLSLGPLVNSDSFWVQPAISVCDGYRTKAKINVTKLATSTFVIQDSTCLDANTNLAYAGTGLPGSTYNWNFGGATIVSGSGQGPYTLKWTSPGLKYITLRVTQNGCLSLLTKDSIYVSPVPTFNVDVVNATCFGAKGTATISGVTGTAPFQYTYNTQAYSSTTVYSLNAGTYSFKVKDIIGCITSKDATITQPTAIKIDSAKSSPSACGNQDGSIKLFASGGTGIKTFTLNAANAMPDSGIYANLSANLYSLSIKDVNLCQVDTQIPVLNQDGPTLSASANRARVACFGDATATITAVGGGSTGPYTYVLGTDTNLTGIFTGIGAGTHQVKVIDGSNCPNFASVTINQPAALSSSSSNLIPGNCNLATGEVTIIGSGGTSPYLYSLDTGATYTGTNNFTGLAAKTYLATIKDDSACTSTHEFAVSNTGTPPTNISASKTEVCVGEAIDLVANNNNLAYSYQWNSSATLSNPTGPTTQVTPSNTTTVKLYVTDIYNCVDSGFVTLTVNQLPVANAGGDKSFCIGGSIQLNGSGTSLATITSYSWTPTTGLNNPAIATPTASPQEDIVYQLVVNDSKGCVSTPNSVVITVNDQPSVIAGAPDNVCPKDTVTLLASGALTYKWSPATNFLTDSNIANPRALVTKNPTVFTVIGTDLNGCKDTSSVSVGLLPLPIAAFRYIKNSNLSVQFVADTVPTNITYVEWDFGDRSPLSYKSSVLHQYAQEDVFPVILVVGNECGFDTLHFDLNVDGKPGIGSANGVGDRITLNSLSLFPNPFNNELYLKLDEDKEENYTIIFYSLTGQEMARREIHNTNETIDLSSSISKFPKGMYYFGIKSKNDLLQFQKIVKQ